MRSLFPSRRWCAVTAVAALLGCAHAQSGYTTPERTLSEALESLSTRAADIFTGQVVAIERKGGVVEVTFALEQSIASHAAPADARYVLREWAGLWPMGQFRYQIGQRALVFVLPPSAAGLSSPVDGDEGVLPLLATTAEGPTLVDARRLDTRLLRAVGEPLPDENAAAVVLDDVLDTVRTARTVDPSGVRRHAPPPRRLPLRPPFGAPWPGRPVPPILLPGEPDRPIAEPVAGPVAGPIARPIAAPVRPLPVIVEVPRGEAADAPR